MAVPLITEILKTDDYVALFALNGVAHTFASTIEDAMFWCYVAATGRDWHEASEEFHRHVRFSWKRPLVDEAVHSKLAGTPEDDEWSDINRRLQALLGQEDNTRNLVSHNPVSVNIYARGPLTGEAVLDGDVMIVPEVSQSKILVKRGRRKDQRVGISEMAAYCEDLIQLSFELESFLQRVLEFPLSHPLRSAHL